MKMTALLLAGTTLGFASGRAKSVSTDETTPADAPKPDRVAPSVTGTATIDLTQFQSKRGGGVKSAYGFDNLEVGQAFGVSNKTMREVQSALSNANRKGKTEMKDEAGKTVNTVVTRHYFAVEVTDAIREQIIGTPLEGSAVLVQRDK